MGMRDLLASAVRGNSLLRLLALTLILSGPAFADPGTEMGVDDDLSIFGVAGTAADPDIEVKGFTVFGSTQTGYTGSVVGAGNVVVNGVLAVSSGAYFVGNSTFTSANKIFINDGSAGQILRKNSGGWLDWDSISSLGDNLGSHVATTTLQMGAYGVNTSSNITAARYQINGSTVLALTGVGSLAVGPNAGTVNTGTYNVFVGSAAGYNNGVGNYNSFLGYMAGYNNTSGSANTFIGLQAGYFTTDGGNNSFFGYAAGQNNNLGADNSFLGYAAGRQNITGGGNLMAGVYAGYYNQYGSANAVFGNEAGGYGSGGVNSFSSSTIMGYQAGNKITTGGDNIFLGWRAGYAVTTGTGNIVIGYNKGTSAATASNELNIGGVLFGDLSAKTIGISTRAPQAALDIVSTGTLVSQYAQIWRNSAGTIVSSMTATGVLYTQSVPAGDNLGSHIATTMLNMSNKAVDNVSSMTITGTGVTGSDPLFKVAGSTMVVLNNGNVGIGTTAPISRLDVFKSANASQSDGLYLSNDFTAANSGGSVNFADSASQKRSAVIGGAWATSGTTDGYLRFLTRKSDVLTEQVRIDNNGNVGIGTTSPGAKLDVQAAGATARIYNTSAASEAALTIRNTAANFSLISDIGGVGANTFSVYDNVNSVARLSILNSGNFGVGTVNPVTPLQVGTLNGAVVSDGQLTLAKSGGDGAVRAFRIGLDSTYALSIGDAGGAGTTYSPQMTLKYDTGNLGISTGAPQARLDVLAGGSAATDMAQIWRRGDGVVVGSMSATGVMMATKFVGDGSALTGITGAADNLGNHVATTTLNMAGFGVVNVASITVTNFIRTSTLTVIAPDTLASSLWVSTSATTPHLYVSTNGNVGIGTGSPGDKLEVFGGDIYADIGPGTTRVVGIKGFASGKKGVFRFGDAYNQLETTYGGNMVMKGYHAIELVGSSNNNALTPEIFQVKEYTTPRLTILKNSGNVGIGTTIPAAMLDLGNGLSNKKLFIQSDGSNYAHGLGTADSELRIFAPALGTNHISLGRYWYTTDTFDERMRLDVNTGNVGISTGAPQARLDVLAAGSAATDMAQIWRAGTGTIVSSVSATGVMMASKFIGDGSGLSGITGAADDLGNHVATTTLNMAGKDIISVSTITVSSITTLAAGLTVSTNLFVMNGNVGIGTESPALKLAVYGVSGYPATSGTTQTGIGRMEAVNNNVLDFGQANASPWGMWIQSTNRASLVTNYPLLLNPNGGNVGIGTTNPLSSLHIKETLPYVTLEQSNATSDNKLWSWVATGEKFIGQTNNDGWTAGGNFMVVERTGTTVDQVAFPNGNVGIGVAAPSYRLVVSSGAGEAGTILAVSTGTSTMIELQGDGDVIAQRFIGDGSGLTGIGGASGPSIDVSTINATATSTYGGVNITTNTFVNGNLGIGLTNPTAALQVQAYAVGAYSMYVSTSATAGQYTIAVSSTGVANINNLVIENRTSTPPSPVTGQIWLRVD